MKKWFDGIMAKRADARFTVEHLTYAARRAVPQGGPPAAPPADARLAAHRPPRRAPLPVCRAGTTIGRLSSTRW